MEGFLENLPPHWRVVPFGEVIASAAFGPRFGSEYYAEDGNVATMRTTDLDDDGRVSYETMPAAKLDLTRFGHHLLRKDDLVITRSGTCGIAAIFDGFVKPVLPGAFLIRCRLNEKADVRYFRYFFNSKPGRAHVLSIATGAVQQNINITNLAKVLVPLPPLHEQRRIVRILSAYDDLIENNLRRIRILEEMARSIYREWFVNFRFPRHDKVSLVDSALGQIPEGWEIKLIRDLCESVSYGFTASATREGIGPKFLRITDIVPDIIDWDDVPFCEISSDESRRYLLQPGDIVVARTGATTGFAKRINKRHPLAIFASYLVRVRTKGGMSDRMLGILMESDEYKQFIKTNIGGAAQPQANAVVLTSMRVIVPPSKLAEEFDRLVEPFLDEIELLAVKNRNLRRTRDLLLPRVLSGTTDISKAVDSRSSGSEIGTPDEPITETQKALHTAGIATEEAPFRKQAFSSARSIESIADRLAQEDRGSQLELGYEPPSPIDQTDRSDALAVIRQVFSDGQPRTRENAIRDVARVLGYGRIGHRIQDVLHKDLLTAVRRGILENARGELRLLFRSIEDYDREFLKQQFLAAIERSWIERNEAIQNFCRWMGFRRTGPVIEETARSLINGLLRESRLEADGQNLIRRIPS